MEICYETKVLKIFQLFDVNRDGVLSRNELAALAIAVNPQVNFSNEEINTIVDEVFYDYGQLIDGEKGLTYEGMLCMYDDGAGDIDREFDTLGFDRNPNEGEDSDYSGDVVDKVTADPVENSINIVASNCKMGLTTDDFEVQVNGVDVDNCLRECNFQMGTGDSSIMGPKPFSDAVHIHKKFCCLNDAYKVFDNMSEKNTFTWNSSNGPGSSLEFLWDPGRFKPPEEGASTVVRLRQVDEDNGDSSLGYCNDKPELHKMCKGRGSKIIDTDCSTQLNGIKDKASQVDVQMKAFHEAELNFSKQSVVIFGYVASIVEHAEFFVRSQVHSRLVDNEFSPLLVSVCKTFGVTLPLRLVLGEMLPMDGLVEVANVSSVAEKLSFSMYLLFRVELLNINNPMSIDLKVKLKLSFLKDGKIMENKMVNVLSGQYENDGEAQCNTLSVAQPRWVTQVLESMEGDQSALKIMEGIEVCLQKLTMIIETCSSNWWVPSAKCYFHVPYFVSTKFKASQSSTYKKNRKSADIFYDTETIYGLFSKVATVMVCHDLDNLMVDLVVHYDTLRLPKDYVHRVFHSNGTGTTSLLGRAKLLKDAYVDCLVSMSSIVVALCLLPTWCGYEVGLSLEFGSLVAGGLHGQLWIIDAGDEKIHKCFVGLLVEDCAIIQEGNSRGMLLQTVEKNHQLMSIFELLQNKDFDFYPGTGAVDQAGSMDAKGYHVNIPWSREGVGFADVATVANSVRGSVVMVALIEVAGVELAGTKVTIKRASVNGFEFKAGENHKRGWLAVTFLIPRIILEEKDFIKLCKGQDGKLDIYIFEWESKNLITMSIVIPDWLTLRLARELMILFAMLLRYDSKRTIAIDRVDKGLVMPPKFAATQHFLVLVPYNDAITRAIFDVCSATVKTLRESDTCVEADLEDNHSPGWKYSHYEKKGGILRIGFGPKDLTNNLMQVVHRDISENLVIPMNKLLKGIG